MGQVVTHQSFLTEPVHAPPTFLPRQIDVARYFGVSASTIRRWELEGLLREYDPHHQDGHFVRLPSGRKRYNLERVRLAILHRD